MRALYINYASDEQGSTTFITDEDKICNKYDYYKKEYQKRLDKNVEGLEKRYGKDNVEGDFVEIDSSKFIDDNNGINKNYKTVNIKKQYKNIYKTI